MVTDGQFREDLFYRLNVIPVRLPSLRERRDDIPLLVQHFVERLTGQDSGRRDVRVTQEAMRQLMGFSWPGNIRQLENVVERALALGRDRTQLNVADLPPEIREGPGVGQPQPVEIPEEGVDLPAHIAALERRFIQQALAETDGNKQQAAERLGLKRTTLVEKVKRLRPQQTGGGR